MPTSPYNRRWLVRTAVALVVASPALGCGDVSGPLPGPASRPAAASLVVSSLPSPVMVGAAATGTVTAKDAAGNTAIGYTGTVHFSSTDPAAQLPADHTFAPADRGSYTFALKFGSAGTQNVAVADVASSSITGSEAVVVTMPVPSTLLYVANGGYGAGFSTADSPPKSITLYEGVHPSPTATIAGSHTGMNGPQGIAVDATGRLYVADIGGHNAIMVYAPGATGNIAPAATIAGSNTGLSYPEGVALDAGGQLYVTNSIPFPADSYSVTVYAPGATGNVAPVATIAGSNTGLNGPVGIAVDATGRLYVANANSISIYSAGATGNAAPLATIQGSSTGLDQLRPTGIAVDASGNVYVTHFVQCFDPTYTATHGESVLVFAAGATGNATPIARIEGSNTGLDGSTGIAVDAAGLLYVANTTECPYYQDWPAHPGSITVYAPGATGDALPIARIAGDNSGLFRPTWIALPH